MAIALEQSPEATAVGLDFSEPMLELARARFAGNDSVTLVAHDLSEPLPDLGTFDLVISGYAIHHLEDARKIAIYREAFACTSPGVNSSTSNTSRPRPRHSTSSSWPPWASRGRTPRTAA